MPNWKKMGVFGRKKENRNENDFVGVGSFIWMKVWRIFEGVRRKDECCRML